MVVWLEAKLILDDGITHCPYCGALLTRISVVGLTKCPECGKRFAVLIPCGGEEEQA